MENSIKNTITDSIKDDTINRKLQTQALLEETSVKNSLFHCGYENPILIGQGAFAKVYRVRECKTGKFFACKISKEHEMLQRESLLMQQINHPLFPRFYQLRQQEEKSFLFMEYLSGRNLASLVARRGKISQRQTIKVGVALAEGLCYLQERPKPIIFRDIKPENIMIQEDGSVKLLDLGSAGELIETTHVITGTMGYSAPEQWEKEGKVGFYSDVYAVGKVMYFMLNGKQEKVMAKTIQKKGIINKIKRLKKQKVRRYRGIEQLLLECVRGNTQERIPDMRCLLNRLKPYDTDRKWKIWRLEWKLFLSKKQDAEYIFQQNVLKSAEK